MAGIARRLTVQLEQLGSENKGGCEGLFVEEEGAGDESAVGKGKGEEATTSKTTSKTTSETYSQGFCVQSGQFQIH